LWNLKGAPRLRLRGYEQVSVMKRILVVEDEPLLLILAVDLVHHAGFEALEASDAEQALEILETVADIVVLMTDIDMPGTMDGLALAAAVRDRWPPVSIIVVSGKQRPTAEDLPSGGVFFAKPYDIHQVTSTLVRMAA
jgi:CheY-like chemotaxis protein